MRFSGKTAIITGASAGIGRATAERMAAEGANVILVDLDSKRLEQLPPILKNDQNRVLIYPCDISDEIQVQTIVSEVLREFGRIDILVNNAAIWRRWLPFAETTSEMWKRYIEVNILGTLYFSRAVINPMIDHHYGRIINVGSVAGVYGNALQADYSLTKGAVIAFTKALAKEVAVKGVLVNCVSPGSVSNEQDKPASTDLAYIGRTGLHAENANLICFLASDEASYISGQNYQIDGCRKSI